MTLQKIISDPFWFLIFFYVLKHTNLICVATWGPTKVFMLYSIFFWLPKLEPRQNVFYLFFYTQVPFWVCQIETQIFSTIPRFRINMWGVPKLLIQNVYSEWSVATSHTCSHLANKTVPCPLVSGLPWDMLPPPHLFAPDVTGSDHLHWLWGHRKSHEVND